MDASLPPAVVQRSTPPLTEEELAAGTVPLPERPSIESLLQGTEFRPDLTDEELTQIAAHATEQGVVTCNDALMLLADLRASRAEVERLRRVEKAARKVHDGRGRHPTHLGGCIGVLSSTSCECGAGDLSFAVMALDRDPE